MSISRDDWTNLAKDDALPDGQQAVQRDQDVVFMLLVSAVHVKLPDAIDGELLLLQLDLV